MPEVSRMPKRRVGRYERVTIGGEKVDAIIPFDLPPARPALIIDANLWTTPALQVGFDKMLNRSAPIYPAS